MQSRNSTSIKQAGQIRYLQRYLSLTPVLAVFTISIALTTWILINAAFPDLLFHPLP
jgi:hypothetical protein